MVAQCFPFFPALVRRRLGLQTAMVAVRIASEPPARRSALNIA